MVMRSFRLNNMMNENEVFNDPWNSFTKSIEIDIPIQPNEELKESSEQQDYLYYLDRISEGEIDIIIDGEEIKMKT